ncbi:hypothetical protein ARZXY2_660 [Arthrobacter sp. ZXY-2]|nr:hypothetical protein ARZXY2_660 [Arthrobacter sp. ZXY-2]
MRSNQLSYTATDEKSLRQAGQTALTQALIQSPPPESIR